MRLSVPALFLFLVAALCAPLAGKSQQSSYGFLSLNARSDKQNTLVNWETIQELTITQFRVQKSTDGLEFATVGTIEASYDTNVVRHHYRFTDANASGPGKLLYYRLVMDINNGRTLYSKSVLVRFGSSDEERLIFSPNVVSSVLPLSLETAYQGAARLQIIDLQGRILKSEDLQVQSGITSRSVDVSALPKGYYMAVLLGDGLKLTQRFLHQ